MASSQRNHLKEFFSQYPTFNYDPRMHANVAWHMLGIQMGWEWRVRAREHEKFQHALLRQSNANLGIDEEGAADEAGPRRRRYINLALARNNHFHDFFARFTVTSNFVYDPSQSVSSEWYRLCDMMRWRDGGPERRSAHEEFKDALVHQFNTNFGTDENSLEAWKVLCEILSISPIPDTLEEARGKVRATHVNLVDLTEAVDGRDVMIFDTEMELSKYTREIGRYFPAQHAHAGGLLRYLLRQISIPGV